MTQDNRLWVLMARRLSGEAFPSEAVELQLMLELSPDKQFLFSILHSCFTVFPVSEEEEECADPGLARKNHQRMEATVTMPLGDRIGNDPKKPSRDLEKISTAVFKYKIQGNEIELYAKELEFG